MTGLSCLVDQIHPAAEWFSGCFYALMVADFMRRLGMRVLRWQFYKGCPLKRKRRVPEGIRLTFLGRESGTRGRQLIIQQSDWDNHGEIREVTAINMEYLRSLVPRATTCPVPGFR